MTDERYKPKYGDHRPLVERVFSSNAEPGLAMKIRREDPALYQSLRAQAEEGGLVGKRSRDRIAEMSEKPTKHYGERELLARTTFSEAEVRRLYVAVSPGTKSSSLQRMKEDEPAKYALLREAAISYGVVTPGVEKIAPLPVKQTEAMNELDASLATRFGFPVGHKVSNASLDAMFRILADEAVSKAEKAAADAIAVAAQAATK